MNQKKLHLTVIASVLGSALLSACGGGGGGDETNPSVPAPVQADSEACVNKALYTAGTFVEYVNVGSAGESEEVIITVQPYTSTRSSVPMVQYWTGLLFDRNPAVLYSVEQDFVVEHGATFGDVATQWITPPVRRPIRMQTGDVFRSDTISNMYDSIAPDTPYGKTRSQAEKTYVGREIVETALGRFEACRFQINRKSTFGLDEPTQTVISSRLTQWVAATAPYRGLILKYDLTSQREGEPETHTQREISKVTTFDLK
ncbi:hypothetical protein HS961_11065 [Comamonas piscis]|uniref:DUF3108 domain-containing protein n=1 Tax=Comamonas piscis TaxID=1562974 RepID=A0A7G5EH51_9BURK|nr:hypothetical protein [Comamonas piscis]QMV73326.1 hypothetical protein HS961_11065 [Comamonas piscis]WSO36126.1 hypothetical protein VUJ63_11100 [Comamonas piscis]